MDNESPQRRLAAILVADVVEYSRLMAENEVEALRALQEHQFALLNPTIGQHHGRIVKLMGDGMLAEFASVVDAVEFAAALQFASRDFRDGAVRLRSSFEDATLAGLNAAKRLMETAS